MAFIMHSLYSLSTNGTAAIVCFPGIMYRSGAEQKIRKYLVDNNRVDTIIQLPDNLFFGTTIATCIMVLKKNKTDNNVVFIDASNEFVKATNNNRLSEDNTNKIINAYINRENIDNFCTVVSHKDIENKKYNLSVSTYVEKKDTREIIDIDVLNKEIDEIVAKENQLRAEIAQIIKEFG